MRSEETGERQRLAVSVFGTGSLVIDARWALATMTLGYIAAELFLVDLSRYLAWDEAVYLAKASPVIRDVGWGAHRALGLPWLLWPTTAMGLSLPAIRIYLAVLHGGVLYGALLPWLRWHPAGALAGGALLTTMWPVVFYGTELYPNLAVALASLATVGWFARALVAEPSQSVKRWLVAGGAWFSVIGIIRPTETVWLALVLGPAALIVRRRRAMPFIAALAAGGSVGWGIFAVEAFARFGDPLNRFRQAQGALDGGVQNVMRGYLADAAWLDQSMSRFEVIFDAGAVTAWWLGLVIAAAAAAVFAPQGRRLPPTLALASALTILTSYLVFSTYVRVRFLLPSFALLSVAAGVGVVRVIREPRQRRRTAILMGCLIAAALWISWHVRILDRVVDSTVEQRHETLELAQVLRREASGQPCAFASSSGSPQLEVASGCVGQALEPDDEESLHDLADFAKDEGFAAVFTREVAAPQTELAEWDATPLHGPLSGWVMYTHR